MTSEKYFLKWIREAGRGHLAAFLSWGSLTGYVLVKVVQLTMSTEYHFFGIGSRELLWICAGLGFVLSLVEFFYLLQPGKLDFYYSLPVKKSTIFQSRYIHGLLHFMIPLCAAVTVCGLFESSLDSDFLPYSASYTGHSILACAAVFLIFYHVGILMITICGNIFPVILGYAACLFYGHVLIGNVFTTWAKNYFRTYYRIPLFEKLDVILDPLSLAGQMTGSSMFDKREVFEYVPSGLYIAAALGWILVPFFLSAMAQKRRKAERVGKIFVLMSAERTAEFLLSFLGGVWSSSFVTDLSGFAEEHPAAGMTVGILAGVLSASAVHFLMEWGMGAGIKNVSGQEKADRQGISQEHIPMYVPSERAAFVRQGLLRRKWQLAGTCALIVLAGTGFCAGASSFDSFLPKENEVEKIGVSVDGLGMSNESYMYTLLNEERYETGKQLETYVLAEEGKEAVQAWAASLAAKKNSEVPAYTHAAVCFHMKNGSEIYRLYPVDAEDFQAFSLVYETDEYKKTAFPTVEGKYVVDARFGWSDGITDTALKLTGEQKEAIVDAYREDVGSMKMENLSEVLPLGFLDIHSEMRMLSGTIVVYPFFSQTCGLLEQYGVPLRKTLSDYQVRSVSVSSVSVNGIGKRDSKYYETPEEIAPWTQKAVPERFDLQPLLYPLNYTQEIRAEVLDETTNSITNIYCYSLEE